MENKENKKNNEKKFNIKELYTNRQYRSIIILVFYVILFAVLITGLRSNRTMVNKDNNTNKGVTVKGFELINKRNFNYKYTVIADGETFIYEGKKYENKEYFTLSKDEESKEYYIVDSEVYVKSDDNDRFIMVSNKPTIVFDFLNIRTVQELLSRAIIVDEDNNKYEITNQTLYDFLSSDNFKVDDGNNTIELYYRNSYVTGVDFDLSEYAKTLGEKYSNVNIKLEYFDFDLVENFNFDDEVVEE